MSTPRTRITATPDGRPVVRCPRCRTVFTPGVGKRVPDKCVGCRAVYPLRPTTRTMLDVITGHAPADVLLSADAMAS